MTREKANTLAGLNIPQAAGVVRRTAGHVRAVGVELHNLVNSIEQIPKNQILKQQPIIRCVQFYNRIRHSNNQIHAIKTHKKQVEMRKQDFRPD